MRKSFDFNPLAITCSHGESEYISGNLGFSCFWLRWPAKSARKPPILPGNHHTAGDGGPQSRNRSPLERRSTLGQDAHGPAFMTTRVPLSSLPSRPLACGTAIRTRRNTGLESVAPSKGASVCRTDARQRTRDHVVSVISRAKACVFERLLRPSAIAKCAGVALGKRSAHFRWHSRT